MRVLSLVLVCFVLTTKGENRCWNDGIYYEQFSKCYYLYNRTMTFDFAKRICSDVQGSLVSIHSAFEETLVFGLTRQYFLSNSDYWIGLSDLQTSGDWEWSDGTSLGYAFWAEGFPMDLPTFDCVAGSASTGKWYNTICEENAFNFVCESAPLEISSAKPVTSTTTAFSTKSLQTTTTAVNDGWTYYPQTNSWYKGLLVETADWGAYEALCVAEGGHIASIHSTEEAKFVQDLEWWVTPYIALHWIGLRADDAQPYAFTKFTDGSPIDYTNWMGGAPEPQKDHCVALYPMQAWVSVSCSDSGDTVGTVCKKPN